MELDELDAESAKSRLRVDRHALVGRAIVALAVVAAWETFVRLAGSFATPTSVEVVIAFVGLLGQRVFWTALGDSVHVLLIGFGIAASLSILTGTMMGKYPAVRRSLNLYVALLLVMPLAAMVPILIVAFGVGAVARIATIVLFAWPLGSATIGAGVGAVDSRLIEMAWSYGYSGWRRDLRVVLPAALPTLLAGLRLAGGRAVVGMVVSELIILSAGLGGLIDNATLTFRFDRVFAVTAVMVIVGLAFTQTFSYLERRLVTW